MANPEEIREKEGRVREFMRAKGLKALLLKRQANFSWLTGGGLNLIGIATEVGVASLLITARKKYAITSKIEFPRMKLEEKLEEQGYEIQSFPWYEEKEAAMVGRIVGKGTLASDWAFPGATVMADQIARLRYSLTADERVRYRWLGKKVSEALEKTMGAVQRGEKECAVIGRLSNELWKDRIDPITMMSAADERIALYRHSIPMEKRVKKLLMVSVNARKGGLIVSTTRFVHLGKIPPKLKEKYRANVWIDCVFMAATRPGVPANEVLRKGIEAYRAAGYPEEWKLHHQGGSVGYAGRDYRTNFQTPDIIQENQAFTWNPSLTGVKSEDTILVTSQGVEMITKPILYPTLSVEAGGMAFIRPDILQKD